MFVLLIASSFGWATHSLHDTFDSAFEMAVVEGMKPEDVAILDEIQGVVTEIGADNG